MRKSIIFLIAVLFSSCSSYDYKITSLEHKKLSFDELPVELKNYLSNPPDPIGDSYKMYVLIEISDSAHYIGEVVNMLIGPWINYHILKDKQKNISYRINRGVPSPYIIFKNMLYIVDRHILLGRKKSAMEAKYMEYQLK